MEKIIVRRTNKHGADFVCNGAYYRYDDAYGKLYEYDWEGAFVFVKNNPFNATPQYLIRKMQEEKQSQKYGR